MKFRLKNQSLSLSLHLAPSTYEARVLIIQLWTLAFSLHFEMVTTGNWTDQLTEKHHSPALHLWKQIHTNHPCKALSTAFCITSYTSCVSYGWVGSDWLQCSISCGEVYGEQNFWPPSTEPAFIISYWAHLKMAGSECHDLVDENSVLT